MQLSNLEFNPQGLATVTLPGLAGDIEAVITQPETTSSSTPIAVICHPHPLYGGSMTNKVVHILAKSFIELEAITVRFNFRGVGKSEGEFDHGIGEAEDLKQIVDLIREWKPESPIWLAGFSFGAYVATRALSFIKPVKFLLVAPPVSMYEFDELPEITVPWMVIQGGLDEVISASVVKKWVSLQTHQPTFVWMEEASHFFHGKLNDVKDAILSHWG